MLDAVAALELVGVRRKRDFRSTLRTVLVHRRRDMELFEEAFDTFWRAPKDRLTTLDLRSIGEQRKFRQPQVAPPSAGAGGEDDPETGDSRGHHVDMTRTYSAREVLRRKDFAEFTLQEVDSARRMLDDLDWQVGRRRSRRWAPGAGPAIDLRRAARRSLRYGGEMLDLPLLERREKPRRLTLICDVSGSMERYTRMLLHFIHSLADNWDRVEAFLFATRLTRVTDRLAHRGVDDAVGEVSRTVPDWAGGTRIGEAIKTFNYSWSRRVLGWGSVVLIISDGWDRGDPDLLGRETARLQRSCHRLIWLNPLLGSETYAPLTRGMQAALPFVDDHLPVHNLASLQDLSERLNRLPQHRPARRQHPTIQEEDVPPDPPNPPDTSADRTDAPSDGPRPTFRHPLWGRR
jgi:uncharacterized protein with von Willebrand factor type A (vWA) domain